jgi:hypothetical protein
MVPLEGFEDWYRRQLSGASGSVSPWPGGLVNEPSVPILLAQRLTRESGGVGVS